MLVNLLFHSNSKQNEVLKMEKLQMSIKRWIFTLMNECIDVEIYGWDRVEAKAKQSQT